MGFNVHQREMKERDEMRQEAVNSKRMEDWKKYRQMRNKCTAELRNDRKNFLRKQYELHEENNDVKSLYNQLKNQMGWKANGPPVSLRMEDEIIRSPRKMANILNKFYKEKIEKLINKLPQSNEDPMKTLKGAMERWGDRTNRIQTLKIQPVGRNHTLNLLKKLGKSSAHGYNCIDSNCLKIAADELASPLNFLINLSINTSEFANKWKIGNIIPLWKGKGKNKLSTKSYRPVLEKLTKFLNNNQMTINKSKTVLQEMMIHQKQSKIKGEPPHLMIRKENGEIKKVSVTKSNILLGGAMQDDLQWKLHIESGENPLLSSVRQKLGALKYVGGAIPEKNKLLLASGLIIS